MDGLAAILNLTGRRCLVVGGGSVALRRAKLLKQAGAVVVVVAPEIAPKLAALADETHTRGYTPDDLVHCHLVVIATDNPAVNEQVAQDAAQRSIWTNRADAPSEGDLAIPAQGRSGPVRVAVDTGGTSAKAAAAIRDELLQAIPPDWIMLLDTIAPYRRQVQQSDLPDQTRQELLRRFASPDALDTLRGSGRDALTQLIEQWINEAQS